MSSTVLLALPFVALLVAYVIACFREPLRWALPTYALSIQFSSLVAVAPGPFGSVSTLLGLLLGAALLIQLITSRRASPRLPLAVPAWLGLLGLTGLSLFWSIEPGVTAERFAVFASLVLLFVALALVRFDRATLTTFETAILVGGILAAFYGLGQLLLLGGAPTPDGGAARFGNDLLGPNNQAASMLLPLAIATARSLTGSARRRLLHVAALLVLLVGVLMTGSRSGLLATVVVFATVVLLSTARRGAVVALAAAAAVAMTVLFAVNPGGIGQRQLEEATDSSGRAEIWAIGMHACQTYCLTGSGWGTFPVVYAEQLPSVPQAEVLVRGSAFEAHNVFLLVAVEAGVLGLLLALAGLGSALVTAIRLPRPMRGPPLGALLGILVTAVFLSNLEYKYFFAVLTYVTVASTVAIVERTGSPTGGAPGGGQLMTAGRSVR